MSLKFKMKNIPFSIIASTVYGQMILNRYDINQTQTLISTGRGLDHSEIEMFKMLLNANLYEGPNVVVDIGANFGTYALGLCQDIGEDSVVHAFEAQRIIHNMLAGTMALNGVENVFCHHVALGDKEGQIEIPQFNYNQAMNFGSIEFGDNQTEELAQVRGNDDSKKEFVRLTTLDSFNLSNVHFIKIDVEGMEMEVLTGARNTIIRSRPLMYIEYLKTDMKLLENKIKGFDYDVHINSGNFLCIPTELGSKINIMVQSASAQ